MLRFPSRSRGRVQPAGNTVDTGEPMPQARCRSAYVRFCQSCRWFVEQHDTRLQCKHHRQFQCLLLAVRQVFRYGPSFWSRPVVRTTSSAYGGNASVCERLKNEGRSMIVPEILRHSPTVRESNMFAFWNLRPRPKRTHWSGGKSRISFPQSTTVPSERSAPSLMHRINVVLPAPFGPISPTSSPLWHSGRCPAAPSGYRNVWRHRPSAAPARKPVAHDRGARDAQPVRVQRHFQSDCETV